MWSSRRGMFQYKTEHLVKPSDNLRTFIVILLHGLTSTCNAVTYPIGPLHKYFVLWQISQLPIYSFTWREKNLPSILSVRAFIVNSLLPYIVAEWAFTITISSNFLSSTLKVLGKTSLHYLFRFWTCRNPFLWFIFFLLFSSGAYISFQMGHTLIHTRQASFIGDRWLIHLARKKS